MLRLKIGLVGKMRSGKDTVAELLEMKGFVNYKFSSGIKAVYNLLAYDKKVGKDRKILQGIGQGLRKIVGEDVWIHYTFEHAMSVFRTLALSTVTVPSVTEMSTCWP